MKEIDELIELRDLIDYIPEPMLGYERKIKLIEIIEDEIVRTTPKLKLFKCFCGGRPVLWKASFSEGECFKYACGVCDFSGKVRRSDYEARESWNLSANSRKSNLTGENNEGD